MGVGAVCYDIAAAAAPMLQLLQLMLLLLLLLHLIALQTAFCYAHTGMLACLPACVSV